MSDKFTVINLVGGPGSGKSTAAAGLFAEMKKRGHSVELVTEYAKALIYSDRAHMLTTARDTQLYILAKQNYNLHRLRGKVRWAIIDSPLFLPAYYVDDTWDLSERFSALAVSLFKSYDNVTFLLKRPANFQQEGRLHDLEQSKQIDKDLMHLMIDHHIAFSTCETNDATVHTLVSGLDFRNG